MLSKLKEDVYVQYDINVLRSNDILWIECNMYKYV
jgi:hypothetical protein